MNDVDKVMADWSRARPDLDFAPLGTVARVMRLSRFFDKRIKDHLSSHGLESGEFDVLTTLRRNDAADGMTTSAFHRNSLVTAGAITNRLDRMAAKGLIERVPDPDDRRVTRIMLTESGAELIDAILPRHLDNYTELLAPLEGEDGRVLAELLNKLLTPLESGN